MTYSCPFKVDDSRTEFAAEISANAPADMFSAWPPGLDASHHRTRFEMTENKLLLLIEELLLKFGPSLLPRRVPLRIRRGRAPEDSAASVCANGRGTTARP
jgi:hypothetical protein